MIHYQPRGRRQLLRFSNYGVASAFNLELLQRSLPGNYLSVFHLISIGLFSSKSGLSAVAVTQALENIALSGIQEYLWVTHVDVKSIVIKSSNIKEN